MAVRRTSATIPVERVRYQRAFWLDPLASAARAHRFRSRRPLVATWVSSRGSFGQPPTARTEPSWATRRAGSRRSSSHSTAAAPLIMAAVEAVLASTQVSPATDTVRQGASTGRPVEGSIRWWTRWLPSLHVAPADSRSGEAARRDRDRDRCGGVTTDVGDADVEPFLRSVADRHVAAEGDQHAAPESPRNGGRRTIGGPRLGGGTEVECRSGRQGDRRILGVDDHRLPPRHGLRRGKCAGLAARDQ